MATTNLLPGLNAQHILRPQALLFLAIDQMGSYDMC